MSTAQGTFTANGTPLFAVSNRTSFESLPKVGLPPRFGQNTTQAFRRWSEEDVMHGIQDDVYQMAHDKEQYSTEIAEMDEDDAIDAVYGQHLASREAVYARDADGDGIYGLNTNNDDAQLSTAEVSAAARRGNPAREKSAIAQMLLSQDDSDGEMIYEGIAAIRKAPSLVDSSASTSATTSARSSFSSFNQPKEITIDERSSKMRLKSVKRANPLFGSVNEDLEDPAVDLSSDDDDVDADNSDEESSYSDMIKDLPSTGVRESSEWDSALAVLQMLSEEPVEDNDTDELPDELPENFLPPHLP